MCGIAGIVERGAGQGAPAYTIVKNMSMRMSNRGPDADGIHGIGDAVFGFRRLSVIDLTSKGNQPMVDADNKNMIVFNGEIYNYQELRRLLKSRGYVFNSLTDTECLLHGYREWGIDLPKYCRGMWAWAIWDSKKSELILCRDRLGQKPLYYHSSGQRVCFASTLGSLSVALSERKISIHGVRELLSYQYISGDSSIYEGVKKVAPGEIVRIGNRRDQVRIKYWDLSFNRDNRHLDEVEVRQGFENILYEAVGEQLVADVDVGLFLSGGIDSSLIATFAGQEKPGITAITTSFPQHAKNDEELSARYVAGQNNLNHIVAPFNHRLLAYYPYMLREIEPLAEASILPLCNISEYARKYVKVVLTGDGGDEVFDGYSNARFADVGQHLSNTILYKLLRRYSRIFRSLNQYTMIPYLRKLKSINSLLNYAALNGVEEWIGRRNYVDERSEKKIFGDMILKEGTCGLPSHLSKIILDSNATKWWQKALVVDIKGRLANDYLMKVDTATMHNSIEARSPFLDHRLFEFMASLSIEQLLPNSETKPILRNIASRKLPKSIARSKKKGFSVPISSYFVKEWNELMKTLVCDGIAVQSGYISEVGVKSLLGLHGNKPYQNLHKQLFAILAFEIWLRVFHESTDTAESLAIRLTKNG